MKSSGSGVKPKATTEANATRVSSSSSVPTLGARSDNGRSRSSVQERLKKQYVFRRELVKDMFNQLMEHHALTLPNPQRPTQVDMVENPLYCPYHRYVGHIIKDCIEFKEWLQRAVDEKKVNLDPDAINPQYHTVNMISVDPIKESGKQEGSWMPFPQVEHQLSSIVLASVNMSTTSESKPQTTSGDEPWRTVRHPSTSTAHTRRHRRSSKQAYTSLPTRRRVDPSKRRMPSRFIPWSEGDAPFPRPSRMPLTLDKFLPSSWR